MHTSLMCVARAQASPLSPLKRTARAHTHTVSPLSPFSSPCPPHAHHAAHTQRPPNPHQPTTTYTHTHAPFSPSPFLRTGTTTPSPSCPHSLPHKHTHREGGVASRPQTTHEEGDHQVCHDRAHEHGANGGGEEGIPVLEGWRARGKRGPHDASNSEFPKCFEPRAGTYAQVLTWWGASVTSPRSPYVSIV